MNRCSKTLPVMYLKKYSDFEKAIVKKNKQILPGNEVISLRICKIICQTKKQQKYTCKVKLYTGVQSRLALKSITFKFV